jgi:hypothetical protein
MKLARTIAFRGPRSAGERKRSPGPRNPTIDLCNNAYHESVSVVTRFGAVGGGRHLDDFRAK